MSLSFINSNWRRRFPFKATASVQDSGSEEELSNDVIVGCRLSSSLDYCQCYISRVLLKQGKVSVEFSSEGVVLGVANGPHTKNNQSFKITGLQPFFAGFVILGNVAAVQYADRVYNFTADSGAIEDSLVTVYPAPDVSGLLHNGKVLTGEVKLELANMDAAVGNETIDFSVVNPVNIISRQDFTAELLTCKNPVIGGINSVEPKKSSGSNNIDIVGIAPVTITVVGGTVQVGSGDIEVPDICKTIVLPPANNNDKYYTDIKTATEQEWKQWPEYN